MYVCGPGCMVRGLAVALLSLIVAFCGVQVSLCSCYVAWPRSLVGLGFVVLVVLFLLILGPFRDAVLPFFTRPPNGAELMA